MTDPGGGLGWRAARHLPRRRGGVLGWAELADRADHLRTRRPLCVLLLPDRLEAFPLRERAEDLLTAPGVAAVDPPRFSYAAASRLGAGFADGLAAIQARRMRLPGVPRALVIFHVLQYPLARALASHHADAELWYGPGDPPAEARLAALHEIARERAALVFDRTPGPAHTRNLPLWERMEALGIESGRLGSERADVTGR